jgi:hypothetical protein
MNESSEAIRRKLALYRGYLADGVDENLARVYLKEIEKAELLLRDSVYASSHSGMGASPGAARA